MWTREHTAETPLAPEAIWKVLADLDNWPRWDTSMETVRLQGPFAVGSTVAMTPKRQDPITSVITAITENECHADETDLGDVTLRFSQALTRGLVPNQLELARQAGTDVKMTSQVVRKLEAKGLLRRETDPADTRARRLRITPEGADAAFFLPVTTAGTAAEDIAALLRRLVAGGA